MRGRRLRTFTCRCKKVRKKKKKKKKNEVQISITGDAAGCASARVPLFLDVAGCCRLVVIIPVAGILRCGQLEQRRRMGP